jgi:hypothetical protein
MFRVAQSSKPPGLGFSMCHARRVQFHYLNASPHMSPLSILTRTLCIHARIHLPAHGGHQSHTTPSKAYPKSLPPTSPQSRHGSAVKSSKSVFEGLGFQATLKGSRSVLDGLGSAVHGAQDSVGSGFKAFGEKVGFETTPRCPMRCALFALLVTDSDRDPLVRFTTRGITC